MTEKNKMLYRSFQVRADDVDQESRVVALSFSSEEPVLRWFDGGFVWEVLDHNPESVDLTRLNRKAPFLLDHNPTKHVGVIQGAEIDGTSKRGLCEVRFGKSDLANDTLRDVQDDIRPNVSVGYEILSGHMDGEKDGYPIYRFKWAPFEISSVAIPADTTVGVGRAFAGIVELPPGNQDDAGAKDEKNQKRNGGQKTMKCKKCSRDFVDGKCPDGCEVEVTVDNGRDFEKEMRNETRRVNEILAMAEKHGASEMAREAIAGKQSVEQFACALLERAGATRIENQDPAIGLTAKEAKRYSIIKALRHLVAPGDAKAREDAAFEIECSKAAAERNGSEPSGILLPHDVLMRDLTVGTAADGGNLVGTDFLSGSFIDALRNKMMVKKLGARTLDGLVGDVAIPKLSGGATTYWVDGDSTTGPTESKQSFGQVALSPKTVGAITDISRKLLKQSSPSVDMLVQDDLSTVVALAIDNAALHGTGSNNQPTGVAATNGIGSVAGGTDGAAPDWDDIIDLWSAVAIDNADIGSLGYLTNPAVIGKLMKTDKGTDTGKFVCDTFPNAEGFTNLAGMRCGASNQVSSTLEKGGSGAVCSAIFFGNWADLVIGAWGGLDLTVDPYTGGASGTLRIIALQDVDIAVRHAESFAAMLDALTA